MNGLVVAPCDHPAALHAVMRWHYSRKMPSGKLVKLGAWEDGQYIGVVLFGRGANNHMAGEFDLEVTQAAELVRVALNVDRPRRPSGTHCSPTSQIVASAIRHLRRTNPGLRLIVSYADTAKGHIGVMYQAGGWSYLGPATPQNSILLRGRVYHARTISARYGRADIGFLREHVDPGAAWVPDAVKHKYVYPLDRGMRRQVLALAVPFPRAVEGSEVSRPLPEGQGRVRSPATAPHGS